MSREKRGRWGSHATRQEIADYVATVGRRVRCTDCGKEYRSRPDRDARLRFKASPCCAARMRVKSWHGFRTWEKRSGREEPVGRFPELV